VEDERELTRKKIQAAETRRSKEGVRGGEREW
jgi:hypothetical protein